jgi:hypothetical protein
MRNHDAYLEQPFQDIAFQEDWTEDDEFADPDYDWHKEFDRPKRGWFYRLIHNNPIGRKRIARRKAERIRQRWARR